MQLSESRERLYPECPRAIPWELMLQHAPQVEANADGATVAELRDRGGLDPEALYYVLQDMPWPKGKVPVGTHTAIAWLIDRLAKWRAAHP